MLQLVCNLSNVCRGTSWQKMVNHRGQMATSLGYFPKILSKISSRGQIFLTYMTYICIRASSVSNQREILSLSWKTEGPKRYPNWGHTFINLSRTAAKSSTLIPPLLLKMDEVTNNYKILDHEKENKRSNGKI